LEAVWQFLLTVGQLILRHPDGDMVGYYQLKSSQNHTFASEADAWEVACDRSGNAISKP